MAVIECRRSEVTNQKQNKWSPWQQATWQVDNMQRGLLGWRSVGQVVTLLSGQLVSAMFDASHQRRQPSRDFSVHYVITRSTLTLSVKTVQQISTNS